MKNTKLVGMLTFLALSGPFWAEEIRITDGPALFNLEEQMRASTKLEPTLSTLQLEFESNWRERLLAPPRPRRQDASGNNWVEQAPKSWPFPMVINSNRPVHPGSAW